MNSKKIEIPQYVKIVMGMAAIFMPLFLILPFFFWGNDTPKTAPNFLSLQAERIAPVGKVYVKVITKSEAEATATAAAKPPTEYKLTDVAKAEEYYKSICSACHGTGLMGAPKPDDKAAWEERISVRGNKNALVESGLNGVNAMPARGGGSMSDDEFGQVVLFMLGKSGL